MRDREESKMTDKFIAITIASLLFPAYIGWIAFLYWFFGRQIVIPDEQYKYDDPMMIEGYGDHAWLIKEQK